MLIWLKKHKVKEDGKWDLNLGLSGPKIHAQRAGPIIALCVAFWYNCAPAMSHANQQQ